MKKILLRTINLEKNYHDLNSEIAAIKNLNIDVYEGEILAIVGPSGCGKSTLLSILTGLEKPSNGNIIKNKKFQTGYMLQTDSLFPWLTILNNTLIGLEIKKEKNTETIKRTINLLRKYGLYDFKDLYPNNLSGGMRQRVL